MNTINTLNTFNETVKKEDFKCLNSWPEGTIGYEEEKALINTLVSLCERFGFGRVPSLGNFIEDIWRGDEKTIEKYQKIRDERISMLETLSNLRD